MIEALLRVIVKVLLIPVIVFLLLAAIHEATAAYRTPPINDIETVLEIKESIETEYSIVFDITHMETYTYDEQARFMRGVALELKKVPEELHNAVVSHFATTDRVLVVQFVEEILGLQGETLNAKGRYFFKEAFMQLRESKIFIHEYGHLIHDVINDLYDAKDFRHEWMSLALDVDFDEFWCMKFVEGTAHAFVLLVDSNNLTILPSSSCIGSIDCPCARTRLCETETELIELLRTTINSVLYVQI